MAAVVHTAARDQYNIFINISSFIPLPKAEIEKEEESTREAHLYNVLLSYTSPVDR